MYFIFRNYWSSFFVDIQIWGLFPIFQDKNIDNIYVHVKT